MPLRPWALLGLVTAVGPPSYGAIKTKGCEPGFWSHRSPVRLFTDWLLAIQNQATISYPKSRNATPHQSGVISPSNHPMPIARCEARILTPQGRTHPASTGLHRVLEPDRGPEACPAAHPCCRPGDGVTFSPHDHNLLVLVPSDGRRHFGTSPGEPGSRSLTVSGGACTPCIQSR